MNSRAVAAAARGGARGETPDDLGEVTVIVAAAKGAGGLGGTAWFFARPEVAQSFDWLFRSATGGLPVTPTPPVSG